MSGNRESVASSLDFTIFQDVTKSMDSLRTTLSVAGVKIPKYDTFNDVFEFLAEYELITTGLDDHQRIVLLGKAFPMKCHRAFYEAELAPLIKDPIPWSSVKKIIVKRFSDADDSDRHLLRLRELKYDPESNKSLLDFAEEIFYSYKRAYPEEVANATSVTYVKAALPKNVRQNLNMFSDFREADNEAALKKALKHYDQSSLSIDKPTENRDMAKDITNAIQEALKGFQKQLDESKQAVVAALKSQDQKLELASKNYYRPPDREYPRAYSPRRDEGRERPRSPYRGARREFSRSPQRASYSSDGPQQASSYQHRRDPSPKARENYNGGYRYAHTRPPSPFTRAEMPKQDQIAHQLFDDNRYIKEFGATVSCLPERGFIMTNRKPIVKEANLNAVMADNFIVHMNKRALVPVRPKGDRSSPKTFNFYVCDGQSKLLGYEAILGLDALKQFEVQIRFDCRRAKMFFKDTCIGEESPINKNYTASVKVDDRFDNIEVDGQLKALLKSYKSVFASIGPEPIIGQPMRFPTVHGRPLFSKMRHYDRDEILEMKDRVSELLQQGVIEPTRSGYAATSRIVPKKSGPGRLVVNYIPLNAITLRDSYSLPQIQDMFGALAGMKYFSSMDCAQGFYQILVDPRDRHKTAFSTPMGNFQYVRCPFGARNSCAVFQAEMNRIFAEGLYTRCVIYVDDILVFGRTRLEHDHNLRWVLEQAKRFNVKLKLEKCHFAKTELDFLGFKITGSTIKPIASKIDTLCKSKPPRDKTELRSLIGRLNFYSRFIPHYSKRLEPFRELFRKNKDFQWLARHQSAFEAIIKTLHDTHPQILAPNSTMKFVELHIVRDSIEVLCLTDKEELICRSSRFLSAAEVNYSYTEKQLLALVLAIDKFRVWLQPEKFTIRVPTKDLEKVMQLVNRPSRVDNLLLRLPEGFDCFKFEVKESLKSTLDKQLEFHLPQEIYYVDGACKANGKPDCVATWAVCAEYDTKLEATGFVRDGPSNNAAELTAAIKACEIAKELGQTEITIITDSKYLHSAVTLWIDKWQTNDWQDHKRKQAVNIELFKKLIEAKRGLKIEWIHVKGHADIPGNVRADMLARSLIDNESAAISGISIGNIDIQANDPEVEQLRERIASGEAPEFVDEGDCIYRIDPKIHIGDPRQVFVPKSAVPYLLNLAHDNQVYGGHLGIKKTFTKLSRFWWPGKHRDVEDYVKSCESCQIFKRQSGLPYGHLHSIPVSTIFENMHIDMVGPVTTSSNGNKYMITVTDAFSKYALAHPCKNITTETIIRFIKESITSIFGEPKHIISDRGVQFRSDKWKEYLDEATMKHHMTTSYHPQSNGIDERFNGTLVRILLSYIDEHQEHWDEQVKWAVYLYNTTVHNSTGYSPYQVLFGATPRSPLNAHQNDNKMQLEQVDRTRDLIRENTSEQIKRAQHKQAEEYNKRHQKLILQIGDLVMVKEHTCPQGLSKKFHPKFFGPCVVIGFVGDREDPRAINIFDPVLLKQQVVALQDLKMYQVRPTRLLNPKENEKEKGEAQASACTDHSTGHEYYDGDFDTTADLMQHHDVSPNVNSTNIRDFDQLGDDNGPDTSDVSFDVSISPIRKNTHGNNSTQQSPSQTVTFNKDISTVIYDPNPEMGPDEPDQSNTIIQTTPERPTVRKPYVMDFIRDDSILDPTYAPTRPKRTAIDRSKLLPCPYNLRPLANRKATMNVDNKSTHEQTTSSEDANTLIDVDEPIQSESEDRDTTDEFISMDDDTLVEDSQSQHQDES